MGEENDENDVLSPEHGRLTFDAEGREGGRYHSRRFHVPSEGSGLTIGRGYDMKMRTKNQVKNDLTNAGVPEEMATLISHAAGLKGEQAHEFIEENDLERFQVSEEQQLALFEIEYGVKERDTRRLATKADVTEVYGATDWENLDPTIKEVLIDLRFRGDYTPSSRRFIQACVVDNDLAAFAAEIRNQENWPNVPADRFNRRVRICDAALA